MKTLDKCEGPLIWFTVEMIDEEGTTYEGVLLECKCGYLIVAGTFFDEAHQTTPILREGFV